MKGRHAPNLRIGRLSILIASAAQILLQTRSDAGDPLLLTQDRKSRATIVLAEKPTSSAQLAASELQYHVAKVSGATLSIVREPQPVTGSMICVGDSRAARRLAGDMKAFADQEYLVRTYPDALLLWGFDGPSSSEVRYEDFASVYKAASAPIGTCYAVHTFLERSLGVRWYYPNEELGTVIPVAPTIAVESLDIRRRPDAPIRPVYPLFANTERLYFNDWDEPRKFQSSLVDPRGSLLYWIRNRAWGSELHNANHSFHGYADAFGKSHPEWFSTKSWDRMQKLLADSPDRYQTDIQPCLTSPGLLEQVVQTARDYFDGKPPAHPDLYRAASGNCFPVMLNDNTNMCGCPECRAQYRNDAGPAGSASHYAWGFANRVAREVRKTHPEAIITNCAYFNYTTPPKGLIFEPNVAVTFCKFYTGYADRDYQEQDYRRIAEYMRENKAQFFTTWEYLLKPHLTEWAFPCLVPHLHAEDVQRLRAIGGFRGGINQYLYLTTYDGDTPAGVAWASPVLDFMNMYWRMKLYDDFTLDIDRSLDEHYRTFFGPGAAGMKSFYAALEKRWMEQGGGSDARSSWGKLGTPGFLKELSASIDQARGATAAGSLYRRRVELIDAGILHYLLKARARYERSAAAELAPLGTTSVARVAGVTPENWAGDATWARALSNEIERDNQNEPAPQKTTFKLAYDDRHLYLQARCQEPLLAQRKAVTRDKDVGGFGDDSLELFVDPTGRGENYYHFCINSLGTVYDALETPTAIGATATVTWDSGVQVKTKVGQDFWELRAALPFAELTKSAPAPGSTWRFNLCRNRFASGDERPFSAWSPTLGSFRKPERFGLMTFNAAADQGRILWNCDFSGSSFASKGVASPLIGRDGWYENPAYANLGWDRSWTVAERDGNRAAVCDINATNPSATVPMHAVQVRPGVLAVDVDYRRSGTDDQPTLTVADASGKQFAYMYAWSARDDLVAIEQPGRRHNFGMTEHGIEKPFAPGRWFGLRLVIDTMRKEVIGFVRSDGGAWIPLNKQPLPYYDNAAGGNHFFVGFGTYKLRDGTVEHNLLEMDNVRVTQLK